MNTNILSLKVSLIQSYPNIIINFHIEITKQRARKPSPKQATTAIISTSIKHAKVTNPTIIIITTTITDDALANGSDGVELP